MKYSTLLRISFLFALVVVLAVAGCKKETTPKVELEYDIQSSQDNALAEGTWNDMSSIADAGATQGFSGSLNYRNGSENSILSNCATLSWAISGSDTIVTIDFGNSFCFCNDGRFRKGKFHVTFNGPYRLPGTVIQIEATAVDNYYVCYAGYDSSNWFKVVGKRTVTNQGRNAANNLTYHVQVNNGKIYNYRGETLTWTTDRQREWSSGEGTATWSDDEYKITGSASGTSFEGKGFSVTITQALYIKLSCPWIVDGKFELTPDGKPTRYIDFHDSTGTCDNRAKITVNNVSFVVSLR